MEGTLIHSLPDDIVKSHVAKQISWFDVSSMRAVSKEWKMTMEESSDSAPVSDHQKLLEMLNSSNSGCEHWPREKFASCTAFGNRIIVVGGQSDHSLALDVVQMYNIETKRWQELPNLNKPLVDCVVAVVSQKIVLLGGAFISKEQFWVESAQVLGYGDHAWQTIQPSESFLEECSSSFIPLKLSLLQGELKKGSSMAALSLLE